MDDERVFERAVAKNVGHGGSVPLERDQSLGRAAGVVEPDWLPGRRERRVRERQSQSLTDRL